MKKIIDEELLITFDEEKRRITCYPSSSLQKKNGKVNVCRIVHDNIKFVLRQEENFDGIL